MSIILPFIETKLAEKTFIRIFSQDILEEDLKWHWDEEDRIIEAVEETDWQFQFDNCLPTTINTQIRIPKGIIHRIIKGTGELKIKVIKL
jgi:hypothetical protein